MLEHKGVIPIHALAILAAALLACGAVAGSSGRAKTGISDMPSDVRITEFEREGQSASGGDGTRVEARPGTSEAVNADIRLVP